MDASNSIILQPQYNYHPSTLPTLPRSHWLIHGLRGKVLFKRSAVKERRASLSTVIFSLPLFSSGSTHTTAVDTRTCTGGTPGSHSTGLPSRESHLYCPSAWVFGMEPRRLSRTVQGRQLFSSSPDHASAFEISDSREYTSTTTLRVRPAVNHSIFWDSELTSFVSRSPARRRTCAGSNPNPAPICSCTTLLSPLLRLTCGTGKRIPLFGQQ